MHRTRNRVALGVVVILAMGLLAVGIWALPLTTTNSSTHAASTSSTAASASPKSAVAKVEAASVTRPNILLLVADDQANSTYNRALMPTVFSQIVDKGIQFDRQYVGSSLCCPSRGEILTGLFEHDSGVDGNSVALARPTIVDALHGAGYRTAMAGKFLNSHPCGTRRAEYDLWVCQGNDSSSYSLTNPRLNVDGTWKNETGVAPEILANYLKNFIATTPADQPFFAMYTPTTPHLPANDPRYASMPVTPPRPPSFNEDTTAANKPAYTRIPPFDAALTKSVDSDFVRMSRAVRGLDDSVKTILNSLGPRADNTLVVYISDNGYLFGEHRGHFKEVAYEEATRTPMAVRFPGVIPSALVGTTSHALVQNVDLAPTMADEAGLAWRVDGKSLMPLLTGSAQKVRDAALIEHCEGPSYPCGTVRRDYLGVGTFDPPSFAGVVEQSLKYVAYATGEHEMYNLATDPSELHNLAGQSQWAAEQSRLDAELSTLKAPPKPDTTILYSSTGAPNALQTTRTIGFTYFANVTGATFVCHLDRDGVVGATAPCPSSGYIGGPLGDGDYTFSVAAVSASGVTDTTPDTRTFGVHSSGIPFTISPPPAASRTRSGTIGFSTTGNLQSIECQLSRSGNGAWKPCSPSTGLAYSDLADGRWTFRVRGKNTVNGVVTNPPSEAWFNIDNAGPKATFTTTPNPSISAQSADFAFHFSEPTAGLVACRLDGGAPSSCASLKYHAANLAAGGHTLAVSALDPLANIGTTTFTWQVDRTPPVVTPVSPSGVVGPNPLIQLTVSEPSTWIFRLDGGVPFDADPGYMFLYSLSDGPHKLQSRAIDAAGNISPVITQTWTQQTNAPAPNNFGAAGAPPAVTIQQGPSATTSRGTAAFSFTADQPNATFECKVDGGGFGPCASGVFYEDLSPGGHTFAVRATAAGRTGATATWAWTITPT